MVASRMISSKDVLGRNFATCAIGDSLTAASANGNSYYNKMVRRSGGAIRDMGSFAIGGTRSDQMVATQLPLALVSGAGTCFCLMGANDISQAISGFMAALKANVALTVTTLRAAGIEPIFCLLPPTNTAGNVPSTVAFNVWLTLYCRYNNIALIDAWTPLATAAGAYTSGLNADAIHWNTVGADLVSANALATIRTMFNCLPLLAFTDTGSDANTFVGNAISFTDTNADGIPDTWFSSGSGGTYTIQNADANALGKWFRCAIAAGTNVGFSPTAVTLASLGWAIGDTLIVGGNIRWADSSQALTQSLNVTGITTTSNQPIFQEKGGASGESITLYQELLITGGTTVQLAPFASGTGYFEANRPTIVNKTKNGF